MNTTQIGPRPADPTTISFAARCFVQDGTTVTFTVQRSCMQPSPKYFTNEADAAAYARKCGRTVQRHESPRMVRVSWT